MNEKTIQVIFQNDLKVIPPVTQQLFDYCSIVHEYTFNKETSLKEFINHFYHDAPLDNLFGNREPNIGPHLETNFSIFYHNEIRVIDYVDTVSLDAFLSFIGANETIRIIWVLPIGGTGIVFPKEGREIGVKFYFHSEEGNHSGTPHVHVQDLGGGAEISVCINPVKILGESTKIRFNTKKKKKALQYIKDHTEKFYNMWLEKTNGLFVEDYVF